MHRALRHDHVTLNASTFYLKRFSAVALFILNESGSRDAAGDITIFADLYSLMQGVEAVDVFNKEYFAYSTDGHRIALHATDEHSPVGADIIKDESASDEIYLILRQYLLSLSSIGRFSNVIQKSDIDSAKDVDALVAIIPEEIIEHTPPLTQASRRISLLKWAITIVAALIAGTVLLGSKG